MYSTDDDDAGEYWCVEFDDGDYDPVSHEEAERIVNLLDAGVGGMIEYDSLAGAHKHVLYSKLRQVFRSTPGTRHQYRTIEALLRKERREFKRTNPHLGWDSDE